MGAPPLTNRFQPNPAHWDSSLAVGFVSPISTISNALKEATVMLDTVSSSLIEPHPLVYESTISLIKALCQAGYKNAVSDGLIAADIAASRHITAAPTEDDEISSALQSLASASTTSSPAGPLAAPKSNRKRKLEPDSRPSVCRICGAIESSEWRRGPDGQKTLCNACGLHYSKIKKKEQLSTYAPKREGLKIDTLLNEMSMAPPDSFDGQPHSPDEET